MCGKTTIVFVISELVCLFASKLNDVTLYAFARRHDKGLYQHIELLTEKFLLHRSVSLVFNTEGGVLTITSYIGVYF